MKNNEKTNVKDQEVIENVRANDHDQINHKRKNGRDCPDDDHSDQINGTGRDEDGNDDETLTDLSLAVYSRRPLRPRLILPEEEAAPVAQAVPAIVHRPQPRHHVALRLPAAHPMLWTQSYAPPPADQPVAPPRVPQQLYPISRRPRGRRNPMQAPREGKSETVPPPFPWATNRRATVHSLSHLIANKIFIISGSVQCKRCERQDEISFDLRQKFAEIRMFVAENRAAMRDRAPSAWMNPALPTCNMCRHENSLKPVIAEKKKAINWLFLLLGELLGCCTLEQLKYFCKHTKNHRTGAKDRVLYLTYLGLCKQLDPNGPFDR